MSLLHGTSSLSSGSIVSAVLLLVLSITLYHYYRINRKNTARRVKLGFYHPYCCHGGGGERVLWTIIKCLFINIQKDDSHTLVDFEVIIYTGDRYESNDEIFDLIETQFKIVFTSAMKDRIRFQTIKSRFLLNPKLYPFATMLFQSLSSVIVAMECILLERPDIFIDTMGGAFCYPFVRLFGQCTIIAYVHYPIISTDMLNAVRQQRPSYNNKSIISSNITVSSLKLLYYQAFAISYTFVGHFANLVIVNSSWTENHIRELWNFPEDDGHINDNSDNSAYTTNQSKNASTPSSSVSKPLNNNYSYTQRRLVKIYPPCNTDHLLQIPIDSNNNNDNSRNCRKLEILSVGQFRPEKDHMLQLKAFQLLLQQRKQKSTVMEENDDNSSNICNQNIRLVLLGSSRNEEDAALVSQLQQAAVDLHIDSQVDFIINAPYSVLLEKLSTCGVGLHTMWNEHFGISVVEMMVAGLIVVAHRSGGPQQDILVPVTHCNIDVCSFEPIGYLASTPEQYAECLNTALNLLPLAQSPSQQSDSQSLQSVEKYTRMQKLARETMVNRFSDKVFDQRIAQEFQIIMTNVSLCSLL